MSLSCHGSSWPTHWTYNDEVVTIGCEPSQLENIHIYYCFSSSTDFNIIVQMVTMDDASGVWSCVCGLEQASTTIFKYGTLSKIGFYDYDYTLNMLCDTAIHMYSFKGKNLP